MRRKRWQATSSRCCSKKMLSSMRSLLEKGADIEMRDTAINPSLHVAATNRRTAGVGHLLENPVAMEAKDRAGRTQYIHGHQKTRMTHGPSTARVPSCKSESGGDFSAHQSQCPVLTWICILQAHRCVKSRKSIERQYVLCIARRVGSDSASNI